MTHAYLSSRLASALDVLLGYKYALSQSLQTNTLSGELRYPPTTVVLFLPMEETFTVILNKSGSEYNYTYKHANIQP